MVRGFALLLACQLAGEAISRGLMLPVPGPVLGLAFLVIGLIATQARRKLTPEVVGAGEVGRVADGLLQNLALLFVPAGVGMVQDLGKLAQHGVALAVALLGSTALTLVVTVYVFIAVGRRVGRRAAP
jgi:holin-like protein